MSKNQELETPPEVSRWLETLSLEEKVAQLFMVGYEGQDPFVQDGGTDDSGDNRNASFLIRFLERGLGGIIFFRDNFESPPGQLRYPNGPAPLTAIGIHDLILRLKALYPSHVPPPLLGIDQEGGQVERLPHTIFPTAVSPRAVALSPQPEFTARAMYGDMAARLASLGFNLDFFPTLDVNLNPQNPIIGVRSFGEDPKTVGKLGQLAMEALATERIIPVGKHFPGHGNGTVDSHIDLPTLTFTEEELQPFQQAIDAGLPAMLIAHGFYPALQTTEAEKALPSSASPAIIQGLLRGRCGFQGVLITDDMCMGAITQHRSAVDAALACLEAGVDILLYRRSTEEEWAVYEAVLEAFKSGRLAMERLNESLHRIGRMKATYLKRKEAPLTWQAEDWSAQTVREQAHTLAQASLSVISSFQQSGQSTQPILQAGSLLLIHPQRGDLGNYAWDAASSEELDAVFVQEGFELLHAVAYPHRNALKARSDIQALADRGSFIDNPPIRIVFVAFNAILHEQQAELAAFIREQFPQVPFVLVSGASPEDNLTIKGADQHIALCNYRPASMLALAKRLRDLNGLNCPEAELVTEAGKFQ